MNYYALQKINCLAAELNSDNDETENETDLLLQFMNFMLSFF